MNLHPCTLRPSAQQVVGNLDISGLYLDVHFKLRVFTLNKNTDIQKEIYHQLYTKCFFNYNYCSLIIYFYHIKNPRGPEEQADGNRQSFSQVTEFTFKFRNFLPNMRNILCHREVDLPVALLSGSLILLLLRASPLWAFALMSLEEGLVTPGITGRPRGGVLAKGELRHSSRNFRS